MTPFKSQSAYNHFWSEMAHIVLYFLPCYVQTDCRSFPTCVKIPYISVPYWFPRNKVCTFEVKTCQSSALTFNLLTACKGNQLHVLIPVRVNTHIELIWSIHKRPILLWKNMQGIVWLGHLVKHSFILWTEIMLLVVHLISCKSLYMF